MMKDIRRHGSAAFLGLGLALAASGTAAADPLTLSGLLTNAGTSDTIAQLEAFSPTQETLTINGSTDSYVGVSLWTLFGGNGGASNVETVGGGNNPILRDYVLATGAGGQSIVSIGEIDPFFGGTGQPYLVAYQKNGVTLSAPQLIVPQDGTGTRDVAELTNLQVLATPQGQGAGGPSSQFTLSGLGHAVTTYTMSSLSALPSKTETVSFLAGGGAQTHNFTGVPLWTLLLDAGFGQGDVSGEYLVATGSDGYKVALSLEEIDPAFRAPGALDDLIADLDSGQPLGSTGFARLVTPGDSHGGRYDSNIVSLEVFSVPEPATPLLLLMGVGALTLLRQRRIARPARLARAQSV
jgi:PEP-CTERM motif